MNKHEAFEHITELVSKLPSNSVIVYLSTFPNSGVIFYSGFSVKRIEIGMDGYSQDPVFSIFSSIDDFHVVCSSFSVLHENSHFEEVESFNSLSFNITNLKSHISSVENKNLYNQNYKYCPHEIHAEYTAFKDINNYNTNVKAFKLEVLDKATKSRKSFALTQKGQCFTDKETFQEALSDLSEKDKSPVGFFEYSLPPKSERELPTGEVEKYHEDALMNYLSDHPDSVIWKMWVDTRTYYIPLDFIFAVSVEYGVKPESQIVKNRVNDHEYPIKPNDINPDFFEKHWMEKLKQDPYMIKNQYKMDRPEKQPNIDPEPSF